MGQPLETGGRYTGEPFSKQVVMVVPAGVTQRFPV